VKQGSSTKRGHRALVAIGGPRRVQQWEGEVQQRRCGAVVERRLLGREIKTGKEEGRQ